MLSQPTLEKLHELKFAAMAEAWELQKNDAEIRGLDFDERFGLLVDVEWLYRKNRSLGGRNLPPRPTSGLTRSQP